MLRLFASLLLAAGCFAAPLRVLVITTDGESVPRLRHLLAGQEVRVVEEPLSVTEEALRRYDVAVTNQPVSAKLEAFAREGKGVVAIGAAHGRHGVFTARVQDAAHPVMQGLSASLRASDAIGSTMPAGAKVLADDGAGRALIAAAAVGRGRVVRMALGVDAAAMLEPAFAAVFPRAVQWAATGSVTAPPFATPRIRLLVVTGGHTYEPSFYTLFDAFDWNHEITLSTAFKRDVRKQYDALLLYNMEQEISDGARANLQAFVESGKAVIVMHHAICSFNDWDWYRDVVGARYLLKPQNGMPPSTYKHDIDLTIRPVSKHPVIAGLPEFHMVDEGYKGMWMSSDVKPLLRMEHPDGDPVVAWISPYAKARVAVIQLGHDHMAHEHPYFRALVNNAVRWATARD